MHTDTAERMVGTGEVARITGLHPMTIRRLVETGEGPACYRIAGRLKFPPAAVRAWLASHAV